jgi:hypothetical protein
VKVFFYHYQSEPQGLLFYSTEREREREREIERERAFNAIPYRLQEGDPFP